jgi:2-polyprenyl-6-methoxyphenol hydroxylase-like FAD-dependent oxidoreductase
MPLPKNTPVLVVGAGPTGLMMACQLCRFEIDFVIIDKKHGPVQTSNAFGVHARTIEIFDQMGVADDFLRQARTAEMVAYYARGKMAQNLKFSRPGSGHTKFPNIYMLEQFSTEKILIDFLVSHGKKIIWDCVFERFVEDGPEKGSLCRFGNETHVIKSDYVVGADGNSSTLRKELNIHFHGKTFPQNFMLADAFLEMDASQQQVSIVFDGNQVMGFFPFKKEHKYRLFSFLGHDGKDPDSYTEMDIREKAESLKGMNAKVKKFEWFSVFKIHSRSVENFSKGKFFLAGDAAHVHSPAGAQGMNTGIQDAYNLAWKLAMVTKHGFSSEILKSYDSERKPVAVKLLKNTDKAFRFAISSNSIIRFIRLWVFPIVIKILISIPYVRRKGFLRISQLGIAYPKSSLNSDIDEHGNFTGDCPRSGSRFPHFMLGSGSLTSHDLLKNACFNLLLFKVGNQTKQDIDWDFHPEDQIKNLSSQEVKNWLHVIDMSKYPVFKKLCRKWGIKKNSFILIRPDMHISYRCQPATTGQLKKYIKNTFGSIN